MLHEHCVFVASSNSIIPPPSLVQAFLAQGPSVPIFEAGAKTSRTQPDERE